MVYLLRVLQTLQEQQPVQQVAMAQGIRRAPVQTKITTSWTFADQHYSITKLQVFAVVKGRAFEELRSGRSLSTEGKSTLKFGRGPVGHRGSARGFMSIT